MARFKIISADCGYKQTTTFSKKILLVCGSSSVTWIRVHSIYHRSVSSSRYKFSFLIPIRFLYHKLWEFVDRSTFFVAFPLNNVLISWGEICCRSVTVSNDTRIWTVFFYLTRNHTSMIQKLLHVSGHLASKRAQDIPPMQEPMTNESPESTARIANEI